MKKLDLKILLMGIWVGMGVFCLIAFSEANAYELKSENTFGVETVEAPSVQFFVSPTIGMDALVGTGTMDANSHVGYGVGAGLLLSQQLLLELSYQHGEQGLSLPHSSTFGVMTSDPNEVFLTKRYAVDLGGRLFVFGRESRFRPYIGGGFAYSTNKLNYSQQALAQLGGSSFYTKEITLKQLQARGSLGLEVALNSLFVVNAEFALAGVLSYSGAPNSAEASSEYDPNKLAVANSLSRATSYSLGLGIGLYF